MLIRAVSMMEVGPPGSPSKRRSQSTAVSFQLRAGVGSDCGNDYADLVDHPAEFFEPLLNS